MFAGRVIEQRKGKAQIMGEWNLGGGETTEEIKVKIRKGAGEGCGVSGQAQQNRDCEKIDEAVGC